MPVYSFKCSECQYEKDEIRSMQDADLMRCPKCGKEAYKKQVVGFGIVSARGEQRMKLFAEHCKQKWEHMEDKDPSLFKHNPENLQSFNEKKAKKASWNRTGFKFKTTRKVHNPKVKK